MRRGCIPCSKLLLLLFLLRGAALPKTQSWVLATAYRVGKGQVGAPEQFAFANRLHAKSLHSMKRLFADTLSYIVWRRRPSVTHVDEPHVVNQLAESRMHLVGAAIRHAHGAGADVVKGGLFFRRLSN
jgi:hypothetical protein